MFSRCTLLGVASLMLGEFGERVGPPGGAMLANPRGHGQALTDGCSAVGRGANLPE